MSGLDCNEPSWITSSDGYTLLGEIGRGAFSRVLLARSKSNNQQVAIKILDLDEFDSSWDEIRKEIQMMSLLSHPNVVRYLCSFVDQHKLWLVMPLLSAGSCSNMISKFFPRGFKDDCLVATILKHALLGIEYLHNDGRMHRDIKAGNILIADDGTIQVADFGVATCLIENGNRKRARKTLVGTPCWMAPEVMEPSGGYNQKADIWSFGITALEIAYGHPPYANLHAMKVMLLTLKEDPPTAAVYEDQDYKFCPAFHDFISKCMQKNPSNRQTCTELLKHKFIQKYAQDSNYVVEHILNVIPRKDSICTPLKEDTIPKPVCSPAKPVSAWEFPNTDEYDLYDDEAEVDSVKQGRFIVVDCQQDNNNGDVSNSTPEQMGRFTVTDNDT